MQKIVLTLLIVVFSVICNAQGLDRFLRKSPLQTTVENSIKSGLYVIRQNYVLRKNSTGEYFTQNGKSEFSYTYSLAVKTCNGYYINQLAATPWKIDENFKKINNPQDYTPIISQTFISRLNEKADYIKIDTGNIKQIIKNQPFYLKTDSLSDSTAFKQYTKNSTEYFTVWITVSDTADLWKNLPTKMIFYTATDDEIKNNNISVPIGDDKILGGIVLVDNCIGLGITEFQLSGIIVPDGEKFKTVMLPKIKPSKTEQTDKIELTPIKLDTPTQTNQKKKRKK